MDWKRQVSLGNELSFLVGISVLIVLTGIIGQTFLVVVLGLLFLVFIYTNHHYLKHAGRQLSINLDKELIKLFKGESDTFSLTFHQKGIYPLMNATIRITIDSVIEFEAERKILDTELIELTIPTSILGRQSVEIKLPFQANRRGVAKIRTLEMRIPHLFGFGEVYLQYNKPIKFEAIIYSSPEGVGGVEKIAPKNQGEYPIKSSFFENMSSIIGARKYVPTDPFNRVHWKASARTNALQTKLYDKTAQFSWTIMINVREKNLEEYLNGLTYLLEYATIKNIPFEIFVNVRRAGKSPYVHHPLGSGKEHLQKALELIARLSKHSVTIPFHFMIHSVERQQILSPYVIYIGQIEQNEELILKGFSKRGVECYRLVGNEQAIVLMRSSLFERRVKGHAI